jgi:hypothetical protein
VECVNKGLLIFLAALIALAAAFPQTGEALTMFSFGCNRDAKCLNQFYDPPTCFAPALNPCAVPCRPPALQKQAVPCAYDTACPSGRLPCHGVSYGNNPYPLFYVR